LAAVHIIATAGHVDHGKSTLVRRLTGIDPDRLAEEKARGLTIDLGFADLRLPSGAEIGFVDVPGHVRFLKNMLAGVGAVDACLFVVAANEGWKPQSAEHLAILELLGLKHGVVVVSKAATVDEDLVRLARLDVAEHVAGTFLASAEVVAVDAVADVGLSGPAGLLAALDRLVAATPPAADRGRPRLWVDRSFAIKGAGTVVTGSLTGGSLEAGQRLTVEPAGTEVRIRGLESHGRSLHRAAPGRRLAVNLLGRSHHDLGRGDALVRPDQWHRTRCVDASLTVLDRLDHEVTRRGAYLAYLGSGEHSVAVRVLGAEVVWPGETGLVRLWLPGPLPLTPGDRYILRDAGRSETVGGGEVLDVAPVRPASQAVPDRSVDRVVAERGWVEPDLLARLTGERRPATVGRWVVSPAALEAAGQVVRTLVEGAGPLGLPLSKLDDRQRAAVSARDDLMVVDGHVVAPSTAAGPTDLDHHPFLVRLAGSPFSPPDPDGVDRAELRALERRGLVVESHDLWFSTAAVEQAARVVAGLLVDSPDGVSMSAIREALGTSRKYALPLVAWLDANGMTRRRGDLRIAGPRLPAADPA
jgi:selenocysteine-specific elongation factor